MILAAMRTDLARGFAETVTRMVIDARGERAPINVVPAQHGVSYPLANC
jgi:hypothetical protein